jgi:HSP20 family molecular chaperone IbpA
MAKDQITLTKTDSILNELNRLHDDISRRAYELFRHQEGLRADALADWLHAEREVVWSPPIELRQTNGEFELEASIAGVEPKDLDVHVTAQDILIKAHNPHRHETEGGTVHLCEFESGRLFRSIHLPDRIDPDSVTAHYRHGVLRLTASIAKATPRNVGMQAA